MAVFSLYRAFAVVLSAIPAALSQDDIGFARGSTNLKTANWDVKFLNASGVLASLKPLGDEFDFLPYDFLAFNRRIQNGSYHWGDINIRYRIPSNSSWTDAGSAEFRTPVKHVETGALLASDLSPTMQTGPLNILREWVDISGDLGLRFTIKNTGDTEVEVGGLGFPASVNNIFNSRNASDMYLKCSFMDPYIGLDAGYLQVTPLKGTGAALVVTPLNNTPLEAYRFLPEESRGGTRIETNGWEGYYEWQVHTEAWAKNEWQNAEPWNPPTKAVLQPGQSRKYGVRFTVVKDGVRNINAAVQENGIPTAISTPGYVLPRDVTGNLFLQSRSPVTSIVAFPTGSLDVKQNGDKKHSYTVLPSSNAWGRAFLTVKYEDGKTQTIHYYVTKPAPEAIADVGSFLMNEQWFVDPSDPFGRSPSVMGYDNEIGAIVEQEQRLQVPGLSDEGGAGAYTAASIKQVFHPNVEEIQKLEAFVDQVLSKIVQDSNDYGVKKGLFFYEPALVPNYTYSTAINWAGAPKKSQAYSTNRAYNYVWPAVAYWSLYRAGRANPTLLNVHSWDWYLTQAYKTIMRCMQSDVHYNNKGLMGETVFGEILTDLRREEKEAEAEALEAAMQRRIDIWRTEQFPFGSEMSWDSTGQEGVYYWARYFGETEMRDKARNSVLGYMPTVAHWAYNGNARRYWDFMVAGKLRIVERQIHHYGSGLNALVMLSAFRDNPSDSYLARVGYGGTIAPLSNIHENGFASCGMHARPEHLSWDGYSADYGPNMVGMVLGSGTYLIEDADMGLVAYGGLLELDGDLARVTVRDPVRQKIFIGQLGVQVQVDAGVIQAFTYNLRTKVIRLALGQLEGAPKASAAVIWIEQSQSAKSGDYQVKACGAKITPERLGSKVPLDEDRVLVTILPPL
ncbi:hypothetical protein HJFPF1_12450 [Paramyrothecium foliicola]|nr:hypothetical protein HJFPF1_12450 [Paramyrothecium foliicola]